MCLLPLIILFLSISSSAAIDAGLPPEDTLEPPKEFKWLPNYKSFVHELQTRLPYLRYKFLYDIDVFVSLRRDYDGLLEDTIAFLLDDKCRSHFGKLTRNKWQKFVKLYQRLITEPCEIVRQVYSKYNVQADSILDEYVELGLPAYRGADYDPNKLSRMRVITGNCYQLALGTTVKRTYETLMSRCRHK